MTSFSKVSSKAGLEHCGVCLGFCCAGADATQPFRRQWVLLMASMHSESSVSEFKRQFIYLLQNLHNLPLIRNGYKTDISHVQGHTPPIQTGTSRELLFSLLCLSQDLFYTQRQNHLASTSQLSRLSAVLAPVWGLW